MPDDLVEKILWAEDRVQQQLQIMPRRRIAVQVDASRRRQDAMKFDQTRRYHREVSEHVVCAQRSFESLHHQRNITAASDSLLKMSGGRGVPFPRVGKSFRVRDVVILVAFERRIEINERDTFVAHVLAQHRKVIAKIEGVFHDLGARQNHSKKAKIKALDDEPSSFFHPENRSEKRLADYTGKGIRWKQLLTAIT